MTLTIGSLFSGAGMLDAGVREVVGGTVAWHAALRAMLAVTERAA